MRKLKIVPRKLTTEVNAVSREYDGTTDVTFTGASQLQALPGGDGLGVLAADVNDVAIDGTVTGSFSSKNVGDYVIALSGLSLKGAKSKNYEFVPPSSATAKITPKKLQVRVYNQMKLVGEQDPSFTAAVTGFIIGETEDDVSPLLLNRTDGENVGKYSISGSGADSNNYDPVYETGTLYIADMDIEVNETAIEADRAVLTTDRTVTCNCQGLVPGETVTLTIYSDPTVIDTVTVPADGTCPFANKLTVPTTVADGDHTLELLTTFENTSGVANTMPVKLATQVSDPGGIIDPPPTDGDGGVDPYIGGGDNDDPVNGGGDGSTPAADSDNPASELIGSVMSRLSATGFTGSRLVTATMVLLVAAGVSVMFVRRRRRLSEAQLHALAATQSRTQPKHAQTQGLT